VPKAYSKSEFIEGKRLIHACDFCQSKYITQVSPGSDGSERAHGARVGARITQLSRRIPRKVAGTIPEPRPTGLQEAQALASRNSRVEFRVKSQAQSPNLALPVRKKHGHLAFIQ
jgi:hypothetical protein